MRLVDAEKGIALVEAERDKILSESTDEQIRTIIKGLADYAIKVLTNLPTEDAEPIVYAHWIDACIGDTPIQVCDKCHTFYPLAYTGGGHPRCPNCGAKFVYAEEENTSETD